MAFRFSAKRKFQPAPAGGHIGVCQAIVDLGYQPTGYGPKRKVMYVFELDAKMENGQPFAVNTRFTVSLHEHSKLRPFLENWLGRKLTQEEQIDIDPAAMLGKSAFLNIQHTPSQDGSTVFANIAAIMPVPTGMTPITAKTPLLFFDSENPDQTVLSQLPEFVQRTIAGAVPPQEKVPSSYAAEPNRDFNDALTF
jgi:hypothetical protein